MKLSTPKPFSTLNPKLIPLGTIDERFDGEALVTARDNKFVGVDG